MKRRRLLSVIAGAFVFIFLLVICFAVVRPAYVFLSTELSALERALMIEVGDKTGLLLSYRSLSPSLLSGVSVHSIEIVDAESKIVLAKIKKARLSYDALAFISKNPLSAFDSLVISGVEVEFDAIRDEKVAKRLLSLFKSGEKSSEKNASFSIPSIDLPFDVIVRDVSLSYSDEKNEIRVKLDNISAFEGEIAQGISFNAQGSAWVKSEFLKNGTERVLIASKFGGTGTIFPSLNGSSATISLSQENDVDFSVKKLDLLASIEDDKIQIHTMRTVFPFSAAAEFDLNKKSLKAAIDTNNFDPLSLVFIKKKPDFFQKIEGTLLSGSAEAETNLSEGKMNGVKYKTDMQFSLPKSLVGEKMRVALLSEGDEKKIKVKNLSAQSQSIDASFSGSFDFARLQPSGEVDVLRYTLPNKNAIALEAYLEPNYDGGTHVVIPIVFLDENPISLEAFLFPEKDSLDFSVELTDYSHAEDYEKATVNFDGSMIFGAKPFVQARAELENIFADSALKIAAFFLPEKNASSILPISENVSTYVLSRLELFGSSDFKTFSYNAPYAIFANIAKSDSEFGTLAFDGSNEMVQISNLNLQFGPVALEALALVDFSGGIDDIAFSVDSIVNSLPYSFTGNFSPNWISVSGSYDLDVMVSLSDGLSGFVQFSDFPVPVKDFVLSLSSMATFSWNEENGLHANVARFDVSEPTGKIFVEPSVSFSGELSKYGFVFDSFSYSDVNSELDMTGTLSWSLDFDRLALEFARIELDGRSPISSEGLSIQADLTNPSLLPFSEASIIDDYYLSFHAQIDSFPFSRFLSSQGADNVLNAEISALGTISSPFVSVDVSSASLLLSGLPLNAHGRAVLDDSGLSVENVDVSWAFLNVRDFFADFDPKSFSGKAQAEMEVSLAGKTLSAPLSFFADGVIDEEEKNLFALPDFFTVSVSSEGLSGSFLKNDVPFKLNAVHIPGQFDIFTDNPHGFKASVAGNSFDVSTGKNDILSFAANGELGEGGAMDIFVTDIEADLKKINEKIDIPFVSFPAGTLSGNVRLSGLTSDPEFAGAVQLDSLSILIPLISKNSLDASSVQITAGAEGLTMNDTLFTVGKGSVMVSSDVTFDRWNIENIFLSLRSIGNVGVPVDMNMPFLHVAGEARPDLDISVILPSDMVIQGSISAENADVEITANELQEKLSLEGVIKSIPLDFLFGREEKEENAGKDGAQPLLNVVANLELNAGNQVRIAFNPFLRALVAPNTMLDFSMDSATGEFSVAGDVTLHGGEISWLSRNFYLREGRIVFNETQDNLDPLVTLRAETREQDDEGNRVTITLSALSQPVSRFNPTFSASPAKSEFEIMTLLGQVVSADSESASDVALAGGDYLVQATVIRKLENALRELLNFDIFSLRTNVFQNAVKAGIGNIGTGDKKDETREDITFGNFFDNSTVYIGKYFGSAIYLDAMFHWNYDKTTLDNGTSVNGVVFQPEFGFEMASPFVNIRLGVAPGVEAIQQNMWVQSSSITLSWKHQF